MTDPVLIPEVTVVLHPVDTTVHPSYPEGWRWAIHVGGRGPADTDSCVGALMHSDRQEAGMVGEQAGAAVAKALRMFGIAARYGVLRLDYDPLPAEADERPLGVWRDDAAEQPIVVEPMGAEG